MDKKRSAQFFGNEASARSSMFCRFRCNADNWREIRSEIAEADITRMQSSMVAAEETDVTRQLELSRLFIVPVV